MLFVLGSALSALVSVTVSVYTVVHLEFGFIGLIYGQLAGSSFSFLFFFILGSKATTYVIRLQTMKEALRLGIPLVPSFAFVFILMHSNKYILEYYYGLDSVGVYSVGFNLGVTISIITSAISKAWYPFFINYISRKSDCRIIFGRILTYYMYLVGLICSTYFIFAKPVVIMLADEKFHDSYMVVGFVALAHFIQVVFNFFLPDLYFSKKVKYVSVVQGLSAVVSLPIFIFMIKYYSIIGCAVGICISNLIAAIFLYVWNKTLLKDCLRIKYQWFRILCALCLFCMTVCMYSILPRMSFYSEIIKSIVCLSILSVVCMLICLNEKQYLKSSIKNVIKKISYT